MTRFIQPSTFPALNFGPQYDSMTEDDQNFVEWEEYICASTWRFREWYDPDCFTNFGDNPIFHSRGWGDQAYMASGASKLPYYISGFVYDESDVGVSNVRVQLFRTSDRTFIREVLSTTGGQYRIPVETNTVEHFAVMYRDDPDIFGTSKDTLKGS
jgi:hypothetical protein